MATMPAPSAPRRSVALLAGLTALAAPLGASAQTVESRRYAAPFVPIAQLPGQAAPPTWVVFPDIGSRFVANLPIGFTFNYLGAAADRFGISPNGFLGFIPSTRDQANNVAFGSFTEPNGLIAAWWDDLNVASLDRSAAYVVLGRAPHRALVVELSNFSASPSVNDGGRAQIWLYEGPPNRPGRFEIRLDGDVRGAYSASVGYEGVTANPSASLLPCTPSCGAADLIAQRGQVLSVLDVSGPELTVEIVDHPTGLSPGDNGNLDLRIVNLGRATASAVSVRAILSTDDTIGPGDVTVATQNVATVPVGGATDARLSLQMPPTIPVASYRLIVQIDDPPSVAQTYRLDDVVVSSRPFGTGPDLGVEDVVPAASGQAGAPFETSFTVVQRGAAWLGSIGVEVYASADGVLDAGDRRIAGPASVALDGSPRQSVRLTGVLPANLSPGSYRAIVVLDDPSSVTELNEFDNRAASATRFDTGPDFAAVAVTVPGEAPPGGSIDLTTRIDAAGVRYDGPVRYALYASRDAVFSAADDVPIGTYTLTWAGQATREDTRTARVPTLGPGAYHVIAVVDPDGVLPETDERNNTVASGTQMRTHVDLVITGVLVSRSARPGDSISLEAEVNAVGPERRGNVEWRAFLSSNGVLDATDTRIGDGQVNLADGRSARLNTSVNLPADVLVRQWRVLVQIDPAGFVTESDETNNVGQSLSPLTVEGADLAVVPGSLEGAAFAFVGRRYRLRASAENAGVAAASGFRYAIYLSDNDVIGVSDRRLFLSDPLSIPAGGRLVIDTSFDVPTDVTAAPAQRIGLVLDAFSQVPESNELNNIALLPTPVDVVPPSPDLSARFVAAPELAGAGEPLSVTRILENLGVEAAPQFDYVYVLSADAVIDAGDRVLARASSSLAGGASHVGVDDLRLPTDVAPGTYRLGLVLDPDGVVLESDERNNRIASPPIEISAADIAFVAATLPAGTTGVRYEAGLFATGSGLPLSVRLASGALPDGLSLDNASGLITGTPTTEGLSRFVARAESTGGAWLEQGFELRVGPPTVPLRIQTRRLPAALARQPYRAELAAVGGVGGNLWTTSSSTPPGLFLSTDGVLAGAAAETGRYGLMVTVVDAAGNTDTASVTIDVQASRQTVDIPPAELPDGEIGTPYCREGQVFLRAEGGRAPYVWSTLGEPVPGLELSPAGELCGTPTVVGRFSLLVRATDAAGLFDTATFVLVVDSGDALAVSTRVLPDALLGTPYAAPLRAVRGDAPYAFTIEDGELPPGLALGADGSLSGSPSALGTWAFVAKVRDAAGREAAQALSIRVLADDGTEPACACSTTAPGRPGTDALALLALLGLAVLRRRR